jgi:5'-phosphate synthase pdxT subunit
MLRRLGAATVEVRLPHHLDGLDGLIIPGGESTTIVRLMDEYGLREPLRAFAAAGGAVWGTCAGMIVLGRRVPDLDRPPLGLMDVAVRRNAFGRQVDSFEALLDVLGLDGGPFRAIFIRAPRIEEVGPEVQVLATLGDGTMVAARQGRMLATAFHPELTDDVRFHRLFLDLASGARTADRLAAGTG